LYNFVQEISNLYMEAASLIPDDTRVDANKFVTVIRSRGLVPCTFEQF